MRVIAAVTVLALVSGGGGSGDGSGDGSSDDGLAIMATSIPIKTLLQGEKLSGYAHPSPIRHLSPSLRHSLEASVAPLQW